MGVTKLHPTVISVGIGANKGKSSFLLRFNLHILMENCFRVTSQLYYLFSTMQCATSVNDNNL